MSETTENEPAKTEAAENKSDISRIGLIAVIVSLVAIALDILGLLILVIGPMLFHAIRLSGLGARALFQIGTVVSVIGIVLGVIAFLRRGKNRRYGIVGLILGVLPLIIYCGIVSFFLLGNF